MRLRLPWQARAARDAFTPFRTSAEARVAARQIFVNALRDLDAGGPAVMPVQAQLYAWLEVDDPEMFARVRANVERWDAHAVCLWVDPDAHLASGESLLRQLAYGMRYTRSLLGVEPSTWRPSASGFPGTWAQLLTHAGIADRLGDAECAPEGRGGTYTTHRDAKERNFALERDLDEAEELAAWCLAVRAPVSATRALRDDLQTAWTIVLRNERDDIAAGVSTAAAFAEMNAEYDRAERIVARVSESARAILPRTLHPGEARGPSAPRTETDGTYTFENGIVRAVARADGTLVELAAAGGPNLVSLANGLAAYVDRPRTNEAGNLERTYARRRVRVRPREATVEDDALVVRFTIGKRSSATLRLSLYAGEPYLRADLAVAWHEDRTILRLEHRLAVTAQSARVGAPHGTHMRTLVPRTPAERALFEFPAQRWVHVDDGERGCAFFAPAVYGWSAHALRGGGVRVGTSLLRSPRRPDPSADRGEQRFSYAFVPTAGAPISALEAAFSDYAFAPRVRLFTCDDPSVMVVATKPADDGDGIIVRVRECDGEPREVALRCGGRMRAALPVDACEQTIAGDVALDGETLRFMLPPYALRAFRIQL